MQLSCIKISNILSFPYIADIAAEQGICFDDDKDHDVNVFIGPNGSGKSNLLEIINQTFKVWLYNDFVMSTSHLDVTDGDAANLKKTITQRKQHYKYLNKHFSTKDKESVIHIRLRMCDADHANIQRVFAYQDFFELIINRYSTLNIHFPVLEDTESLIDLAYVDLLFQMREESADLILSPHWESSDLSDAWIFYLQYFELFQLCLVLWNHYSIDLAALWEAEWIILPEDFALHGNFATLGPSREFTEEQMDTKVRHFSWKELDNLVYSQDTKKHGLPPIGFFLCKKRLLEHHESQSHDMTLAILEWLSIEDQLRLAKQKADYHSNFYEMLRYFVKTYTSFDMVSFVKEERIILFFVDQWDNFYRINELSSWEQSFLYIIFTLFGYGLENGMMILDEPETHLHPQKQWDMLRMLQDIAHQYSIQILMATHSPLMITEDTISHVYRLHRKDKWTHVHNSSHHFTAYESNLIQMLKFGYIAKVFFVNTIIMVEWETDEYFFDYYLRYLRREKWWSSINNFAVINVNGKWWYKTWKKFLAKFGINSYFIADWDNIVDTGFQLQFSPLWDAQRKDFFDQKWKLLPNGRKRHRRKSYGYLVEFIKKNKPEVYSSINAHIDALYDQGVFMLRHGDLEWYLGLRMKWLDETVRFCHTGFGDRLADRRFDEERDELEKIFLTVFSS